ncbi:hypothetical protein BJX76DRAFT_315562 [Aspergillus varians]
MLRIMMHQSPVFFAKILILVAFFGGALCGIGTLGARVHTVPSQYPLDRGLSNVYLSEKWQVLGPFQCGTREAIWGADPLEYWGGFKNLSFDEKVGFTSPLATDGVVRWSLVWANITNSHPKRSRAELVIAFPQVDWKFLQSVYGWSALQYQAWVRGYLSLYDSAYEAVAISTDGILDLFIDGRRYFGGDFYSYRRAPLILSLTPGEHVVELRLIRDVRAIGGQAEPTINVVFETELRYSVLTIDERSILIPETTDWNLGSTWASVNVQSNVAEWLEILSLSSSDFPLAIKASLHLAPYQTRPLAFQFTAGNSSSAEFSVDLRYRLTQGGTTWIQSFQVKFATRALSQPQRLTYMHPAGIVSYAILRPPPLDSPCFSNRTDTSLPIIIGLHGAGLEADSPQVRGMLDATYGICAWMLFPSGVTSWSGDDWHTWGVADIKGAVRAIPDWIRAVGWSGPGVSADDWMVVGHSNGGQGVWFLATHYPDNVIAAAPVSGYTSIENYVSYNMWQDSEPLISAILHQSRASFKHELLLANAAGIPILQQHGSDDTNVPAYHSRLMHGLLEKSGWSSDYVELPNEGHWFDGVMTTAPLLKFYEDSLRSVTNRIPSAYTIHVPPSGDMASKGGICVDQLQSPDMFGRLHVKTDPQQRVWYLQTQNIHRFHLSAKVCRAEESIVLIIDETDTHFKVDLVKCEFTWYVKDADDRWIRSQQNDWQSISQRYGHQMGAMDAILRTNGIFTIKMCSAGIEEPVLQISRNLLQYFAADSHITSQCGLLNITFPGNVITIALGNELPNSVLSTYPIHVTDGHVILHSGCFPVRGDLHRRVIPDTSRNCQKHTFDHKPAMGALFIRPLDNESLELVVWGADMDGLEQAARLVPTLTGAGQPEFLILSDSCRWKGHAGLYAAGHFDKSWQISTGSYIAKDM